MSVAYKILPKEIVNKTKKETTEKLVEFCALDVRPFEIVTGRGFTSMVQHFVSVGARLGELDVTTILAHPTTLSRNVSEMKNKKHVELFPIIQKAIKNNECAATSDGWSDDYKKNHYLSMSVHFFDDDFVLQKKVLFTSLFNEKKKTGLKIRNEVIRKLVLLGFEERDLQTIPMVTDRGSNMVKAFKGKRYNRKNCLAHVFNRILKNAFDKYAPVHVEILLDNVKAIVRYFKQSSKSNQLEHTPKQEVETRWNSKLAMLISVTQEYTKIMSLLTKKQRNDWSFNIELANELVRLLKPFKEASDQLEGDNYPTLNYVLVWRTEIIRHLTEEDFLGPVKTVAKAALHFLEEKFPMLMEYKVACFLDPRYRELSMLTESERNGVLEEIHNLIEKIPDPDPDSTVLPPPAKKPRYSMFEEHVHDKSEHEIQSYIQTADFSKLEKSKHLVEIFWRDNQFRFPKLCLLARKILCVPATSAPTERTFSHAKRTIDPRRTNTKPITLDNLLYLRDSYLKVSKFVSKFPLIVSNGTQVLSVSPDPRILLTLGCR